MVIEIIEQLYFDSLWYYSYADLLTDVGCLNSDLIAETYTMDRGVFERG